MKTLTWACHISGGLLTLAAIPHATMGLAAQFEAISQGFVTGATQDDLVLIWVFSSITMFLMGTWLLFLSIHFQRGNTWLNWLQALLIALGLIGFGVWGGLYSADGKGLFGFAVMGFIVLLPLLIFRPYANVALD